MTVRFTNDILARQTLFDLGTASSSLVKAQQQLSSGKRINTAEDDPYGASQATSLHSRLADNAQYQKNISDAQARTSTADSARGNVTDILQRARELVVEAANGTESQQSLNAISSEMSQLKGALQAQANSTYNGRYIFGGTVTNAQPYTSNSYSGNALPVQRMIGDGQTVNIGITGPAAFGTTAAGPPATQNVFDAFDSIINDLNTGNTTALGSSALTSLDSALTTAGNARTAVGAMANRLDTQNTFLTAQQLSLKGVLSDTEDADTAQVAVAFSQSQTAYQAALQVGAKIIQPTLLDFLS
jgi:flagellar hook-associated protein 3 FlgL